MSVIVKGMDMPLQCQRCPLSDDESRYCKAANKYIPMLGHPKFCPLVEVPTPHGDLIDRDALMKDGWLNLHKEVMRMGGYAIHELPLKNPSIAVIISAEGE